LSPHRALVHSLVIAVMAACAEPSSDETGGSEAGASSSAGADTSSASTSDSSSGVTGGSTTSGDGDGLLQCIETCEVPSECCLPGTACPGPYPNNVDCRDGFCVRPHCIDDAECEALSAGMLCRPVRGVATCVLPCTDDAGCVGAGAHQLCRGTTDMGEQHCFEHCDQAGVFCGNQSCDPDSGLCLCETDGECLSGWQCHD
jgi:hypothetical protein